MPCKLPLSFHSKQHDPPKLTNSVSLFLLTCLNKGHSWLVNNSFLKARTTAEEGAEERLAAFVWGRGYIKS